MKEPSPAGSLCAKRLQPAEAGSKVVFFLCALASTAAIAMIVYFLVANAWPALQSVGLNNFLLGVQWDPDRGIYGILPMILSAVYVSCLAMILALPMGLGTSIYLVFYCPKALKKPLNQAVNVLAGIPSIVFGLFGLAVLVPLLMRWLHFSGKGLLSAGIVLGIMIIPTIVSMSSAALTSADHALYENSLALGASKERSIVKVACKAAKSGILASIILAVGRAVGETMAVVMVAGNAAILPASLLSPTRTLTANIVLEMGYAQGLHRQALIAGALVLLLLVFLVNIAFQAVKNKEL